MEKNSQRSRFRLRIQVKLLGQTPTLHKWLFKSITRYRQSPGLLHMITHYTKWLFGSCEGVDPNRNFNIHWGEEKVAGASLDPCHDTYAGPRAFSEPETKAISDYIMKNRKSIRWCIVIVTESTELLFFFFLLALSLQNVLDVALVFANVTRAMGFHDNSTGRLWKLDERRDQSEESHGQGSRHGLQSWTCRGTIVSYDGWVISTLFIIICVTGVIIVFRYEYEKIVA